MRIVNLKHKPEPPWLYCGRYMGGKQPREASPLGNPFKVRDHGRDALPLFRRWLHEQIKAGNPRIMFLLREAITPETTLACWCVTLEGEAIFTHPEVCHCQIVWRAWRYLQGQTS